MGRDDVKKLFYTLYLVPVEVIFHQNSEPFVGRRLWYTQTFSERRSERRSQFRERNVSGAHFINYERKKSGAHVFLEERVMSAKFSNESVMSAKRAQNITLRFQRQMSGDVFRER